MKSIRQRLVLRRKPRVFAVGTVRQWEGGSYVKTGPGRWARMALPKTRAEIFKLIPAKALADSGGLAGVARAFESASPEASAKLAQHVVDQMSTWDVLHPPELRPLPEVLASLALSVPHAGAGASLAWWLWTARRSAAFNDGLVDRWTLDRHLERAMRVYDGQLPDVVMKAKGARYTGPRTIADINLASWMEFFREGGQLNQPAWLETNRFKKLRSQFEMLASMHQG